jgi:endonuclease V-like protein UPF0215 family
LTDLSGGRVPLSRVRIRQAKRQVRVLGLAVAELGGCFLPLGVVYRGRLGVEGVVGCRPCGGDAAEAVSEAVRGSPHYGQVRVLLLDLSRLPGGCALDPFRLADLAGRPVLALGPEEAEVDGRHMFRWGAGTVTSAGLTEGDARGVLDAVSVDGYPEALRVAWLVAGALGGVGLHKV